MVDTKEYFEKAKLELAKLLEERKKAATRDERALQTLFERYPFILLSALSGDAQYDVLGNIIISQPKLKSFNGDRQPDFLIVTQDSLNFYFNFIEIEDPSKRFFDGTKQIPSDNFFQAYNQLMQWKSFKNEVIDYSEELLRTLFHENFNNNTRKILHYKYILVYGFSEEIQSLGERHNQILQGYFQENGLSLCTYSRLLRNIRLETPLFAVKKEAASNKYKAIGLTPFTKYKIDQWSDFHNIIEKVDLISSSNLLSEEEKKNLVNQINNLDGKSLKEIIELNEKDIGMDFMDPESHKV